MNHLICFFEYVFLSQLCLREQNINFSVYQRKLLIGEFLSEFFLNWYAQQKEGISEPFLSILNTAGGKAK